MSTTRSEAVRCGIEALNVYCGLAYVPVAAIFQGRGLDPRRLENLMMEQRSIGLPFEDSVTHAVNAARPIVEHLSPGAKERIELVVVSTESGLDFSKSVTSYVHHYLGLGRHCRILEVKQACYAATGALQLAAAYVVSGVSPGSKALVIASDVALVDGRAEYAEPATGVGAAALLVGAEPRVLTLDLGAFGSYGYETMDSARPSPEYDVVDVDRSLFAYLDCLSNSFDAYLSRVEEADFCRAFDYLAFHTPFAGLVRAGHRKLARERSDLSPGQIEEDFNRRVLPSLAYPCLVGNLCSGSVYLALASVIDRAAGNAGARVGLFSYGSGCCSEFFSGLIDAGSAATLAEMGIRQHLDRRVELSFDEYSRLLAESRRCLVPAESKEIDLRPYEEILGRCAGRGQNLALSRVEGFHRRYEWI